MVGEGFTVVREGGRMGELDVGEEVGVGMAG
jgi:hypothetical protein